MLYRCFICPEINYVSNSINILNTSLSFTPICDQEGNTYDVQILIMKSIILMPPLMMDLGVVGTIYGCTIIGYLEYNPLANVFDNSCQTQLNKGVMIVYRI